MAVDELLERYVNFYTDFAFKKLFGNEANKELLICFFNSLLDGKEKIENLTYLNSEHLEYKGNGPDGRVRCLLRE